MTSLIHKTNSYSYNKLKLRSGNSIYKRLRQHKQQAKNISVWRLQASADKAGFFYCKISDPNYQLDGRRLPVLCILYSISKNPSAATLCLGKYTAAFGFGYVWNGRDGRGGAGLVGSLLTLSWRVIV